MSENITQEQFADGIQVDGIEVLYAAERKDPLRPFRFAVTVMGGTQEYFLFGVTKISGLKWKVGTFRYFDGGAMVPKSVPTRPEYEPVVLTRAVFNNDEVWEWCKRVFFQNKQAGDSIFRLKELRVYQLPYYDNRDKEPGSPTSAVEGTVLYPERGWHIFNSYPSEYDMGELDRDADGVSLATITIEHEGVIVNDAIKDKYFSLDPTTNKWSIS